MKQMNSGPTMARYPVGKLKTQVRRILGAVGVPADAGIVISDALVDADRRGINSHGLLRLPLYVEAVESGGIDPDPSMTWQVHHGAVATLDAAGGFGQVAMARAVDKAKELTAEYGCATVAVHHSSHYGAGAYWTSRLAARGYASLLVSTTGITVVPFGGARKLLGTNPLTLSFPAEGSPVTADLATSAGAYGKIVQAARTQSPIPADWAVDMNGKPTTDAQTALDGALRPFGGHKGSAIAVMLELFAAAGTGGKFACETTDIWEDRASRMGTGHLLFSFDPARMSPDTDPLTRATQFREAIHLLPAAQGDQPVLAPGDVEQRRAESNQEEIALPDNIAEQLRVLADRLGV